MNNLYEYCGNNPVNCVDPTGHSAKTANWSANEYYYLSTLAKGHGGNAKWARAQLAANNCYVDKAGHFYTNAEVWAARNGYVLSKAQHSQRDTGLSHLSDD